MQELDQLFKELQAQRQTLEELLSAMRAGAIRTADGGPRGAAAGKNFLALLSESLDRIRANRTAWIRLEPARRREHPGITELLRVNQNLMMKMLVLERENEEAHKRIGQVPERGPRPRTPGASEGSDLLSRIYRQNSAT